MTKDRASGAAANEWGRVRAREIASKIGGVMKGRTSIEATLDGKKVVIKCAANATDSVGVTFKMLDRLDPLNCGRCRRKNFIRNARHSKQGISSRQGWHSSKRLL